MLQALVKVLPQAETTWAAMWQFVKCPAVPGSTCRKGWTWVLQSDSMRDVLLFHIHPLYHISWSDNLHCTGPFCHIHITFWWNKGHWISWCVSNGTRTHGWGINQTTIYHMEVLMQEFLRSRGISAVNLTHAILWFYLMAMDSCYMTFLLSISCPVTDVWLYTTESYWYPEL